jgi:hypothetical protein
VTAVETPAPPPPTERRCPRCNAELTPEQEWCLNCGADVGSEIAAPQGWRVPVVIVSVLLAILGIALVLALIELADDAEQVSQAPAPTPTAAAPAAPTAVPGTPTPEGTIPPASGGDQGSANPEIDQWPAGKSGWTIVIGSADSQQAAEERAQELAAQGVPTGVLDTKGFTGFPDQSWIIFSGQYESRDEAEQALNALGDKADGATVERVEPASGASGSGSGSSSGEGAASPTPQGDTLTPDASGGSAQRDEG